MAKYKFYSDSGFVNFLDEMESMGADETVLTKDPMELVATVSEDFMGDYSDVEHCAQLWGGERVW